MKYRLTISIGGYGVAKVAEANAKELFGAFERTYPAAAAAVGAKPVVRGVDVMFFVDGTHVQDAFQRGWSMFGDVVLATKLRAGLPIVRFVLEAVTTDDVDVAPS